MADFERLVNVFRLYGSLENKDKDHYVSHPLKFPAIIVSIIMSGAFYICLPVYVYNHRDNFAEVAEAMSNASTSILVVAYTTTIYFQNDRLWEMLEIMERLHGFYMPQHKDAKRAFDSGGRICQFLSNTFPKVSRCIVLVFGFVGGLDVYLAKDFEARSKIWVPFDVHQAPVLYGLLVFGFVAGVVLISAHVEATIMLAVCMLVRTVAQLRVLRCKFEMLRAQAEDSLRVAWVISPLGSVDRDNLSADGSVDERFKTEIDEKMNSLLAECVAHHCEILRFIAKFEEFWSSLFSVHITVCLFQSVLRLIASDSKSGGSSSAAVLFFNSLQAYLQLAAFCYLSQKVTDETERLNLAIYSCDWIDADERFKKSVRIIISMGNQPSTIKTAGFVPLSLDTFSNILQAAYSYYTVLEELS